MKLTDVIDLSISIQSRTAKLATFSIPLIFGYHTNYVDRVRAYSDIDELLADGFDVNSAIYRAAAALFAQKETIDIVKVGRLAAVPAAEIYTLTPTVTNQASYSLTLNGVDIVVRAALTITPSAVNSTLYTVTIDDVDYEFTSDGSATAAEIVAGLINAINADTSVHGITASGTATLILTPAPGFEPDVSVGANLAIANTTATEVVTALKAGIAASTVAAVVTEAGTSTLTLTASTPGELPSIDYSSNLTFTSATDSNSNEGFATELAAIQAFDDDWYAGIMTDFSADDILDAAAAIEGRKKLLLAVTGDAAVENSVYDVNGTDIGSMLKALGYKDTRLFYHRNPTSYPNAAEAANLRFDPGTATWSFKTLTGILPEEFSTTQYNNLVAKNVNSYSQIANIAVTSNNGVQTDGMYTDLKVFGDFLEDRIGAAVFTALANNKRVPFDDRGFSLLKGAVSSVLEAQAQKDDSPLIPGSTTVTVPKRVDVPDDEAALRYLNQITFTGTLSGAVHRVRIRGSLSL